MHAVCFDRYGDPEVLALVEVAVPMLGEHEVLVRVAACGVNPADLKWRAGLFEATLPLPLPMIPGYDIAGVIEAVGDQVKGFAPRQRVVAMLDPLRQGGYAQAVAVPETLLARLPEGLPMEVAAALPTAGLTGVQMIEEFLDVQPGTRVLISGATGAVGRLAMFAALQRGAQVVAAVRHSQVVLARELGACEVVDLDALDWPGEAVDYLADTLGGALCARLIERFTPATDAVTVATNPVPGARARFVQVHAAAQRLETLLEAVAAGELVVLVAQCLPLSAAAEAHRLLARGGLGGKIVLLP